MLSLGLALLGALSASTGIRENPLELAEAGSVQCYEPNEEKRTCRSIESYRSLGEQRYATTAIILISPAESTTLETTTQVEVKNGAVCGLVRADEIAAGRLRVAGHLIGENDAKPYMAAILQSLKALIGKEVCTTYVPSSDGFLAKVAINGVYRANTDQRMKWIGPNDGYTVSP